MSALVPTFADMAAVSLGTAEAQELIKRVQTMLSDAFLAEGLVPTAWAGLELPPTATWVAVTTSANAYDRLSDTSFTLHVVLELRRTPMRSEFTLSVLGSHQGASVPGAFVICAVEYFSNATAAARVPNLVAGFVATHTATLKTDDSIRLAGCLSLAFTP